MNFNITEHEKIIDKISDSTLQLIYKNLPLLSFSFLSK